MTNDAKLGLLVGVLGVIAAATIPVKSPAALGTANSVSSAAAVQPASKDQGSAAESQKSEGPTSHIVAPALLPADLGTTAVVRSKKEVEGTTTARTSSGDVE